jgi:hypothetical protein
VVEGTRFETGHGALKPHREFKSHLFRNVNNLQQVINIAEESKAGELNCEYLEQFKAGARRREAGPRKFSAENYTWLACEI